MPRRFAALAVTALLAAEAASGCAKSGSDTTAGGPDGGEKKYTVAVIPKGTTHEFWKSVHAGAVKAAMEAGDVEVLWKGPQLESDLSGQVAVVQDFVARRVDGIVVAPLDSQGLVPYVAEAVESDIPVVVFDSALAPGPAITSFVATDNHKGGRLAADRLAEAIGGEGDVILLRYKVGSESTEQREAGFLDGLRENHPKINVLVENEYAGTTPEQAFAKATQLLQKHRDTVDGVFTVCEPNADGTLGALKELDLAGKVKLVVFDPSPALIRGLGDGHVHGIVLQDPVAMGYLAIKTLRAHLQGETVEPRIDTGVTVATKENLETPEVKKLLTPERFGE